MAVNALVMEHVFTLQYHYCSLPTKLKVKLGLEIRKKTLETRLMIIVIGIQLVITLACTLPCNTVSIRLPRNFQKKQFSAI